MKVRYLPLAVAATVFGLLSAGRADDKKDVPSEKVTTTKLVIKDMT